MSRRSVIILRVVTVVIGVPLAMYALAVSYFLFVPSAEDYAHRLQFDDIQWRGRSLDGEDLSWPTRLRMVDDLIAKKRLDGLTRSGVEALLGPGDETAKWKDWHLIYQLGPERRGFLRLDFEWLVLRFDSAGRVVQYRIVGD